MTPITNEVRRRIQVLFPREQWSRVESLLQDRCGADLPLAAHRGADPAAFDRVRLAVLKLSRGSIEGLECEIENAHCDWRDTLVAAGFADDVTAHERWMPEPDE